MKKNKDDKCFIWYCLRISLGCIILFWALLFLTDAFHISFYVLFFLFIISVIFNFIVSIIHLKKYNKKVLAIISLIISILFIVLFFIFIFVLIISQPPPNEEDFLKDSWCKDFCNKGYPEWKYEGVDNCTCYCLSEPIDIEKVLEDFESLIINESKVITKTKMPCSIN